VPNKQHWLTDSGYDRQYIAHLVLDRRCRLDSAWEPVRAAIKAKNTKVRSQELGDSRP
jgi:hypothetical protein